MRILTWNVYFGGHMFEERRDALVAELARRRPEVIALQEVTAPLHEALAALGYWMSDDGAMFHELRYGVVILARVPVRGATILDLPSEMGRKLITVELASGLRVASVHLESGRDERPRRLEQLAVVQARLVRYDDVVWVGDMNFAPGTPEDAAIDPSFVDVWAALHPGDPGYTLDTDVNTMRLQLKSNPAHRRIDRVFLRGTRLRARTIERVGTAPVDLDGTFVSDHFGLEVDLA